MLEERLSVRVLASAVDDRVVHAHPGRSSSTNRSEQYDMLPHHQASYTYNCGLNNSDFGKDVVTP